MGIHRGFLRREVIRYFKGSLQCMELGVEGRARECKGPARSLQESHGSDGGRGGGRRWFGRDT